MPRFSFYATVTVSAYTTVEAENYEAALDIAEGREAVLGDARSGARENESWVIEDADGSPQNIQRAED